MKGRYETRERQRDLYSERLSSESEPGPATVEGSAARLLDTLSTEVAADPVRTELARELWRSFARTIMASRAVAAGLARED
jgi:hypothetical protein